MPSPTWEPCFNMSYAAIHHHYLILPSLFSSHKSQDWQMPSGLNCLLIPLGQHRWIAICARWWSTSSSNSMATRVPPIYRDLWHVLLVCNGEVWWCNCCLWWLQWTGGKSATTVTFTDDMKLTMKKDHFLSNSSNKQCFINMLSSYLQKGNCQTCHLQAAADHLIVQLWKVQERWTLCSLGMTLISLFYCVITWKWCPWIVFPAWAKGQFKKMMRLEHESSEREARSRCVQQPSVHPCNSWLWYNFSHTWNWQRGLFEDVSSWSSFSQSGSSI